MPVPQLPLELVAIVLDHLFADLPPQAREPLGLGDNFGIKARTWRRQHAVLRVCKSWQFVARAAIWREVALDFAQWDTTALAEYIVLHIDDIAPHVRTLVTRGPSSPRHPLIALALQALLTKCPRIDNLQLGHRTDRLIIDGEPLALPQLLPTLPYLSILTNLHLRLSCTAQDAIELVYALPQLVRLEVLVIGFNLRRSNAPLQPVTPPAKKLRSLRNLTMSFTGFSPPALHTALATAFEPTFSTLGLGGDVPPQLWEWAVSCPSVTALQLQTPSIWTLFVPFLPRLSPSVHHIAAFCAFDPPRHPPPHRSVSALLEAIPASSSSLQLSIQDPAFILDPPVQAYKGRPMGLAAKGAGVQQVWCTLEDDQTRTKAACFWREIVDGKASEWYQKMEQA
ncbi:hypothetical protein JCM8097_000283 [Rhodosporidiobolus ruineniae]